MVASHKWATRKMEPRPVQGTRSLRAAPGRVAVSGAECPGRGSGQGQRLWALATRVRGHTSHSRLALIPKTSSLKCSTYPVIRSRFRTQINDPPSSQLTRNLKRSLTVLITPQAKAKKPGVSALTSLSEVCYFHKFS